jgi:hypothetical protein
LDQVELRADWVGRAYAAADLAGGGERDFRGYGQEGEDAAASAEWV